MAQTDVDMVKLAKDVGAVAAETENNHESLKAIHRRFDEHVKDETAQFTKISELIARNALESTEQHHELASKVESITNNLGHCVASHVEKAVEPVLDEVKNHRKLMWSVAAGIITVLLALVGYLLLNGSPWDVAIAAHISEAH